MAAITTCRPIALASASDVYIGSCRVPNCSSGSSSPRDTNNVHFFVQSSQEDVRPTRGWNILGGGGGRAAEPILVGRDNREVTDASLLHAQPSRLLTLTLGSFGDLGIDRRPPRSHVIPLL